MINIGFSIVAIPVFLIMLAIPLLLGVYVYRDARRRSMNAALWTLVVILTPTLLGFIIYLLIRSSYSDLACPSCHASVKEQYITCPHCGTKLKATCAQCNFPIEPDWKICPQCATPIDAGTYSTGKPIKKEDTSLTKFLILIIAVPFILLMTIIISAFAFLNVSTKSGSMTTAHMAREDYATHAEISAWLTECDKNPEKTYVLTHLDTQNDSKISAYLIYRPSASDATDISATPERGLFRDSLDVYYTEDFDSTGTLDDSPGYQLTMISYNSDEYLDELNIYVNNEPIECEIQEAAYNIELYRFISE